MSNILFAHVYHKHKTIHMSTLQNWTAIAIQRSPKPTWIYLFLILVFATIVFATIDVDDDIDFDDNYDDDDDEDDDEDGDGIDDKYAEVHDI